MGLSMEVFWAMIPREFHFCYDAYQKTQEDEYKSQWEQTRMLAYYTFLTIPKKGQNPSFHTFKNKHLPFYWDKIENVSEEDEIEVMQAEENAGITIDAWMDRIKQIQENSKSRPLNAGELKSSY